MVLVGVQDYPVLNVTPSPNSNSIVVTSDHRPWPHTTAIQNMDIANNRGGYAHVGGQRDGWPLFPQLKNCHDISKNPS
jgi:hypothetical protein